ncbi:MAG: PAS domain S-box protein [Prolixibacteraceae bacterium]|nr:PAS domain S-box protein [Prolixibacteraceae bacterium]
MNFDFLFQHYEGVLSLTKRKTKVLTSLSLAGLAGAVIVTVLFAVYIDYNKYIPGVIVMGSIFALNLIFLFQGNYRSAVYVIFLLPLSLYFFFINKYYSVVDYEAGLRGMLTIMYLAMVYLVVFSQNIYPFLIFYAESVLTIIYFIYSKNYPFGLKMPGLCGIFCNLHPVAELSLVTLLAVLIYKYYDNLIAKTAKESQRNKNQIGETFRQAQFGIMVLKIERDSRGEKSGIKIVRTNNAFNKFFKLSRQEIADADYSEIFVKIFRDSLNWQDEFFHSPRGQFMVHIKHNDKWFQVHNAFPEPDLMVSSFINVTPMRQEIQRLKNREKRLTSLLGSLPDIFFIIEKDGTYVDYVSNNPELMKLSHDEIIGKTIFEMGFSSPMSYQIYSSIQHVIENDNIETIEYGMELENGKNLIFEMRLARLNDNQVISIGRDITSRKEYQYKLIEAKKKIEEASRLKSAFLENISHEIRTPMNAIVGFSALAMNENQSNDKKNKFLEIVSKNAEYLMDIITNIIDVSEIETGTMTYTPGAFPLNQLMYEIYQKYHSIVETSKPGVKLNLLLGNDSPDFEIVNDNYLLAKILNHLIDNAIKFTTEGDVTFGYEQTGEWIKFFVKDTGIGITRKDFIKIFEFFHQVDNRISRTFSGTGAGLSIVKNLTELIGSKIEFESSKGKGSYFHFTIAANAPIGVVSEK